MQILRFDEEGISTPRRKKNSRGMIALGLVATLFGVGSALASTTIVINGTAPINVGQGVSDVTRCDGAITINANSGVFTPGNSKKPKFYFSGVTFSGVDQRERNPETGIGCGGQIFDFQIWRQNGDEDDDTAVAYTCGELGLRGKTDEPGDDDLNDLLTANDANYALSAVSCFNKVITINVPILDTESGTFKVPFARHVTTPKDQTLDISYFTLSSRSPA